MNTTVKVKFSDGAAVAQTDSTAYLGGLISVRARPVEELENRLGKAVQTATKLKEFWKHVHCSLHWKVQVYNAVVVSQLVYGLDTIIFSESMEHKIDAFQAKGLRQILGIAHSYWSRISNEEVLDRANFALEQQRGEPIQWCEFKGVHENKN